MGICFLVIEAYNHAKEEYMANLVLFKDNFCPYCRKVLNFIKKKNISDIELKNTFGNKENKEYLIKNGGKNQVPCLFIDGKAMYESKNIISYLEERLINPDAVPEFNESSSEKSEMCPLW